MPQLRLAHAVRSDLAARPASRALCLALLLVGWGCDESPGERDAGGVDAGSMADAAVDDGSVADGSLGDAGVGDAGGGGDAAQGDAGDSGLSERDAGLADAGPALDDAGATSDAGGSDAGSRDAGADAGPSDAGTDAGTDAGPPDAGGAVTCTEPGLTTRTIRDSASVGTPDTYFFDVFPGDPFCAEITGGGGGTWGVTVSNGTSGGVYCRDVPRCAIRVPAGESTLLVTATTTDIGSYTLTVRSIPR